MLVVKQKQNCFDIPENHVTATVEALNQHFVTIKCAICKPVQVANQVDL